MTPNEREWATALVVGILLSFFIGVWFGMAFAIQDCAKLGSLSHKLLTIEIQCTVKEQHVDEILSLQSKVEQLEQQLKEK